MPEPIDVPSRLEGLDLARYLALVGMVFVNFRLAMQPATRTPSWLDWLFHALEGKASATFVVLAGVGLTLATRRLAPTQASSWTARRALFLLGAGLLNLLIFPADIIHYYGAYFLLAISVLHARTATLIAFILGIAGLSAWALMRFDYSHAWNWTTLVYADLWTPAGFGRNLVFNGFHPILPWMALFIYGMLLGRLRLAQPWLQATLCWAGLAACAAAQAWASLVHGTPWAELLGTSPMPPGPVYLLLGAGTASFVIGLCLQLLRRWAHGPWAALLPAGRMTLTLYLAHIVLGMGVLEELNALDGSATLVQAALAAAVFCLTGTAAAWAWSRRWAYGPAEALMRRLANPNRRGQV